MLALTKFALNIVMASAVAGGSPFLKADTGDVAKLPVNAKQEINIKEQVKVMAFSVEKYGKACENGLYVFCEMASQHSRPFAELLEKYEFKDPEIIANRDRIVEIYQTSTAKVEDFKAKLLKEKRDSENALNE